MLLNYLKVAIRSLLANKSFSLINIAGLAIGIAASAIIVMVVAHEFSYDRFHVNGERIVRAEKKFSDGRYSLYANPQFAPLMMETDPRVINYLRTFDGGRKIVSSDRDHILFQEGFIFADSSFFGVFSFPLLEGDHKRLGEPSKAIITEETALKYFNTSDVLGRVLTFDRQYQLEIVGVAKNPPINSSVQFSIVASFNTLMTMPERNLVIDNSSGFPTYLLLKDKNDLCAVSKSMEKTEYVNTHVAYSLAPMFDNHFNFNFGSSTTTKYAYTFLSVALLILMLALINYMSLTTARALTRAKEISVRKVAGAGRMALSLQFYFESAVITIFSFLVALVLVEGLRPFLPQLLGIQLDEAFLRSPYLYVIIGLLILLTIGVSGGYPALIIPRFRAADGLKGQFTSSEKGAWFRKTLMVFQFSVTACLAICAVVMNKQVVFMKSINTGISRDKVLAVPVETLRSGQRTALKIKIKCLTGISGVATASLPLYKSQMSGISSITSPANDEKVGAKWLIVDSDFISVMNIKYTAPPLVHTAGSYHILNQTGASAFGITTADSDYNITLGGDHVPAVTGNISGIVQDFNYQSLRDPIQPLILSVVPDSSAGFGDHSTMYVALNKTAKSDEAIEAIRKIYSDVSEGSPFTWFFLDDAFNGQQINDVRLNSMFQIFTTIAISLACLGLFGLITFSSERRRKELSIRKLLGASITRIVTLITSDLIILLLISIALGTPIAIYLMKDWLSGFFYQPGISVLDIVLPISILFSISIFVMWIQGIRTALQNPVINLKNE